MYQTNRWVGSLLIAIGLCSITPTASTVSCTTDACSVEQLESAARIVRIRDASINPCDNFYRFVCGNAKKAKEAEAHPLTKVDYVDHLIQKGVSDFKPYRLIEDFYKTCINKNAKGQQALVLLRKIIKNLGRWPVLEGDQWKESGFNWIDFSSNAKKAGFDVNFFLDWVPKPIYVGSRRSLSYSLMMAESYFDPAMTEKTTLQRQIYGDYMLKIAGLLGAEVDDFVKDMEDAFEFEEKLANINAMESGDFPQDVTVEELQKRWPSINWKRFVDKTLIPWVDTDNPILMVWNDSALTKFAELMSKTPKRVQATYGIWKVVQYSIPFLTDEFREMQKLFHRVVGHLEVPRKEYCINMVKKYLKIALEYKYLDQHKSSQAMVRSIGESIKQELIRMMNESKTLTKEAQMDGIKTVEDIPLTIGPTAKLGNSKELRKYYADAKVVKGNFLQAVLNLNVFKMKKEFCIETELEVAKFNEDYSVDPEMPEMQNDILYIPTSMIPGQLFNQNRPMSLNFGATGSYIAFNLAEPLVHIGTNFTALMQGEEPPNLECFRQHSDLPAEEAKYYIRRTKPENLITQYLGFRSSRAAYETYEHQHGAEPLLPGVPYTGRQLFWIEFAQSICDEFSTVNYPRTIDGKFNNIEYMMMRILTFIPEIGEDFQCPVGSKLNPERKCSWW
ncbi:neprilysin-2-like [Cotesia glomerata]|uniref:Uncharacterized protein n=1 Tax=Cotesia glomerata TaxID=32391 RepID=A0AAV7ISJ0_COTGL|nr:neprilysin-2-like [Cotesia glomerata]KAH0555145.1 hypothetical protein KQX54_015549 [Cotesia glomerata]